MERAQQFNCLRQQVRNSSDVRERLFVFIEIKKFKFLWYSFTTDVVVSPTWVSKRRDKKNWLGSLSHCIGRKELAWSNTFCFQMMMKILLLTFANMSKWKQNQETKQFTEHRIFIKFFSISLGLSRFLRLRFVLQIFWSLKWNWRPKSAIFQTFFLQSLT